MLNWNKKEAPVLGLLGSGGGLGYLAGGAGESDSFWISEADRGSWGNENLYDIAGDDEGNIYTGGHIDFRCREVVDEVGNVNCKICS